MTELTEEETEAVQRRLHELRMEHRDLDDVIAHLQQSTYPDMLQITRLKKRKLLLKDMIYKLEEQLVPDIPA
jgi:hypothetical protein